MKRKYSITLIIISLILIITGIVLSLKDDKENNKLSNEKKEQQDQDIDINNQQKEEKSLIIKDISFVKASSLSKIEIYDGKYIIDNSNKKVYNLQGTLLFDASAYNSIAYKYGYFKVSKDKKYGVLDTNFNTVVDVKYESIDILSNNCIILGVRNKKNYTLYDIYNTKTKKEYSQYVMITYISDDLIIMKKPTKNIDEVNGIFKTGELQLYSLNLNKDILTKEDKLDDYEFLFAESINEKYIIVDKFNDWNGYKTGVIDSNYKEVIPFEYDEIEIVYDELDTFKDTLLLGEKDDSYDLFTINNKKILSIDDVEDVYLTNNIISIEKENESVEYYDLNGKLIHTSDEYSYAAYINNDKYIINGEKCIYLDMSSGKSIKKEIDGSFCRFSSGTIETGYLVKHDDSRSTVYNNNLEPVFKNKYDYIILRDNFCIVKNNYIYKVLSYDETPLVDKEFDDYDYTVDGGIILITKSNEKYYFNYN